MSFAKAKRFNQELVGCGPPPTAYNPKHLGGGNAVSFPKGERFRDQSSNELDIPNMQLTRSHSSSSVGSTESGASHKSTTVRFLPFPVVYCIIVKYLLILGQKGPQSLQ